MFLSFLASIAAALALALELSLRLELDRFVFHFGLKFLFILNFRLELEEPFEIQFDPRELFPLENLDEPLDPLRNLLRPLLLEFLLGNLGFDFFLKPFVKVLSDFANGFLYHLPFFSTETHNAPL